MELKDFIAGTISQITDGIIEGDKYVKVKSGSDEGVRSQYTKIHFDVAVTTNEEEKDKLGGKVSVVQIFNVGASSESSNKISNFNRIQFELLINVSTNRVYK
jgi:serine kinase of HPr protein (carbohydrate metabolism regulator)